jgi:hypothetical protein
MKQKIQQSQLLTHKLQKLYYQKKEETKQLIFLEKQLTKNQQKSRKNWEHFAKLAQNIKRWESEIALEGDPQDFDPEAYHTLQLKIDKAKAEIATNDYLNMLSQEFEKLKTLYGNVYDTFSTKLYIQFKVKEQNEVENPSLLIADLDIDAELKEIKDKHSAKAKELKMHKVQLQKKMAAQQLIKLEQEIQQQVFKISSCDAKIMEILSVKIRNSFIFNVPLNLQDKEYLLLKRSECIAEAIEKTKIIINYFATSDNQIAGQAFAKTLKCAYELVWKLASCYSIEELIFCSESFITLTYNQSLNTIPHSSQLLSFVEQEKLDSSQYMCLLASLCVFGHKPSINNADLLKITQFVFDVMDRQICMAISLELATCSINKENVGLTKQFMFFYNKHLLMDKIYNNLNPKLIELMKEQHNLQNVWIRIVKQDVEIVFLRQDAMPIELGKKASDIMPGSILDLLINDPEMLEKFNNSNIDTALMTKLKQPLAPILALQSDALEPKELLAEKQLLVKKQDVDADLSGLIGQNLI